MRDPIVAQKVGNRSGIGKGRSAVSQRPAKRASAEPIGTRLKSLLTYVPLALRIGVIAIICLIAFVGYRAAASASFFAVRTIETKGASRASVNEIHAVVRREVGQTNVWRADLEQLSKHLARLPWVRSAVVTRVLPDGMRVRITEREPKAVVRNAAGRFVWVDDDAVYLGEMSPTDQMPAFFLRGWNEEESASAQTENRERIRKFLELQGDWERQGLSERVSEVNLHDIRDVRVQLAGDDSQIEVRLGSQDQGVRLGKALTVLDAQRPTSRGPLISYIDLSQGKRAIVGLTTGNRVTEPSAVAPGVNQAGRDTPIINPALPRSVLRTQ